MKITKAQLSSLLQTMLHRNNRLMYMDKDQFISYSNAWFEDLKYQEFETVKNVFDGWENDVMPTSIQVKKFCRKIESSNPSLVIDDCEFKKFGWPECEISKSNCSRDRARLRVSDKFVCDWHYHVLKTNARKISGKFEPTDFVDENGKTWIDREIERQRIEKESKIAVETSGFGCVSNSNHQTILNFRDIVKKTTF